MRRGIVRNPPGTRSLRVRLRARLRVGCCCGVRIRNPQCLSRSSAAAASPSVAVCRETFGERLRCHVALPRWCAGKGSVGVATEGELNPERGPGLIRGAQGKSPMSSSVSHGSCPIKTRTGDPSCVSDWATRSRTPDTGNPDTGLTMCHSAKDSAFASPSSAQLSYNSSLTNVSLRFFKEQEVGNRSPCGEFNTYIKQ